MTITDPEVLKMLKKVNCYELEVDINEYPDNEREGRSDIQFFADEVSYLVSAYHEDGTGHHDSLVWAREILRSTHYGKAIPLNAKTLKPIVRPYEVEDAKSVLNESRRLEALFERLKKRGIHGQWY